MKNPIIIEAQLIKETEKAYYLDCEGDKESFPKSKVEFNPERKELQAPKWLLEQKFPGEQF